jgi:nitroreductase
LIGPFGTRLRFRLVAVADGEGETLKGLGTYGFIRGATGYIVGAVDEGAKDMEDYGYKMEGLILHATALGLGTCWLGGSFSRSGFASRIQPASGERVPAVAAVGHIEDLERARDGFIRRRVRADARLPWENLFFDDRWGNPLPREKAAEFAEALEMVRCAPSASNRQPWRIVNARGAWHFHLQRTRGYRQAPLARLLGICDMQRIDLGIAMCHFALACRERGLPGAWEEHAVGGEMFREYAEYIASWVC